MYCNESFCKTSGYNRAEVSLPRIASFNNKVSQVLKQVIDDKPVRKWSVKDVNMFLCRLGCGFSTFSNVNEKMQVLENVKRIRIRNTYLSAPDACN